MANKNRDKGHRYERWWRKVWEEMGFTKVKTARQGSRLMDDCGVDLINIPINMQLKAGYPKGINYSQLFEEIETKLKDNMMDTDPVLSYPIVIAHKKGRKKSEHFVVIQSDDFIELMKERYGE